MTIKDWPCHEEIYIQAIFSETQARFTVVDMGSGKIALHNAKYNRDLHSSIFRRYNITSD